MNLLHTIGLMTRAEHERTLAYSQNMEKAAAETAELWEAKFKRAATDLAAQAKEIALLKERALRAEAWADHFQEQVIELTPDAEAMRKKRDADRKRMAGKRNG